jgi:hypothetical protein
MKYPKRSQYKCAKSPYRVRNWPEYETGLRNRGDLTVWFSDAELDACRAPTSGTPVQAKANGAWWRTPYSDTKPSLVSA